MTITPPRERTIRTDADLFALWQTLMGGGGFGQRSLWLVFLDRANRTLPVIVPLDGISPAPDALMIDNLTKIVDGIVSEGAAASVAMLLSRPGPATMTAQDRQWAAALRAQPGREMSRWPIHLATSDRIQVFAPDDLVGAS